MLGKVSPLWSQPWPELLGRGCGGMQRHREGCRGQGLLSAHSVTCGAGSFSLPCLSLTSPGFVSSPVQGVEG